MGEWCTYERDTVKIGRMKSMYGVNEELQLPSIDDWEDDIFADYGGSDRKCGLISPKGERYLVKYAETHTRKNELDTSYVNNILAEYLSSHILSILGYPVHETFLAGYQDEPVVCCKNFTGENEKLIEFGRFLQKHYDSGEIGRVPDIKQMRHVFQTDRQLKPYADNLWSSYWERFIGDALIGNFDRHMGNFGYLVSVDGMKPSPIYDNGSTLFPALSEHGMNEVLSEPVEVMRRTLLFPKAAITVNGTKARYYDLMASDFVPELSDAIRSIGGKITAKMPEICRFIEHQDFLSDTRKHFYTAMLMSRYNYILMPAWERCINYNYDEAAKERLSSGTEYTEDMFVQEYDKVCRDVPSPKRRHKVR